jgi:putative FmdB family regulatory protein
MPTYDYVCNACDHAFELFQKMTDAPKRKCPSCGRLKLERLIGTGAGVIFKGGGFYETDYRSESYKKDAEAEKTSKEPKGDASKETKPDAKSDKKPAETKAESKGASKKKSA